MGVHVTHTVGAHRLEGDSFARNEWLLWRKPDSTWSWVLRDLGERTRLVTRVHVLYDWARPAYAAFGLVPGIKQRAESMSRRR